jgi:predicted nucleic acid-binding protein
MQTIYIETSVISYLTSRASNNLVLAGHQIVTKDFWDRIDVGNSFISELVYQEAAKGDPEAAKMRLKAIADLKELAIDEDCKKLAELLIEDNAIPKEFPEDALHIAVASVHNIDVIVTWNFKHINNPVTRKKIKEVIYKAGYHVPELCSPEEFLGDNYE